MKQPREYLEAAPRGQSVAENRLIHARELPFEFMLNALRLVDGVPRSLFVVRTGIAAAAIDPKLLSAKSQGLLETDDPGAAASAAAGAFSDDLQVEDRLNDEVREILRTHSDEMTRRGVQYHDMFKMIKAELVRKRKLIL